MPRSNSSRVRGSGRRSAPIENPSRSSLTSRQRPKPMKENRARRSPPSTLSSRKRGSNAPSFMYAETGVSRSPEMSNGGFMQAFSEPRTQKNPSPGLAGDGFESCREILSRLKPRSALRPLRYECGHHDARNVFDSGDDICG